MDRPAELVGCAPPSVAGLCPVRAVSAKGRATGAVLHSQLQADFFVNRLLDLRVDIFVAFIMDARDTARQLGP